MTACNLCTQTATRFAQKNMQMLIVLWVLTILTGCAATQPVPLGPVQEEPSPHVRLAMQLYEAESYPEAAISFLRAATLSRSADLRRRYLGAAALCRLKDGDRAGFLETEGQLEASLSDTERWLPPREIADIIGLGRLLRGDRPPRVVSFNLQRLLDDLNDGGVK